jgi:hypothetical protein
MLSPAVMSVKQVFHLYDVEFGVMLSVESAGLPSIVMCGDRGEAQCCGLIKVWNCGGGWIPSSVVVSHAQIWYGPNLRSRHPMTTGATTCLIENDLLTN